MRAATAQEYPGAANDQTEPGVSVPAPGHAGASSHERARSKAWRSTSRPSSVSRQRGVGARSSTMRQERSHQATACETLRVPVEMQRSASQGSIPSVQRASTRARRAVSGRGAFAAAGRVWLGVVGIGQVASVAPRILPRVGDPGEDRTNRDRPPGSTLSSAAAELAPDRSRAAQRQGYPRSSIAVFCKLCSRARRHGALVSSIASISASRSESASLKLVSKCSAISVSNGPNGAPY